jgi:hypothetical protein
MIYISLNHNYHFFTIFSGMNIAILKNRFTFEAYLLSNKDCVGLSTLTLDKRKTYIKRAIHNSDSSYFFI